MANWLRLLQKSDSIIRLYGVTREAAQGNPEAREYLKKNGIWDIADIWREGGGSAARLAVQAARDVWAGNKPNVVDGEFRVLDSPPWEHFLNRLIQQPNSANIIVGPTGQGKTQLAIKLAARLSEAHGYTVNWCCLFPGDVPDFGKTISLSTLVKRMNRLQSYLQATQDEDEEDLLGDTPAPKNEKKEPPVLPPQNRVVVIDEVGMAMSSNAQDPARRAALRALAESRHVRWHVVWIGQQLGQFPMGLLAQSICWIKRPDGREAELDRMDVPLVRHLWGAAREAHESLRSSEWYAEPWKHQKAWAYVDAQSINGGPGYQGLCPFSLYKTGEQAEPAAIGEDDADA